MECLRGTKIDLIAYDMHSLIHPIIVYSLHTAMNAIITQ